MSLSERTRLVLLMADDDRDMREMASEYVETGYDDVRVVTASDGADALGVFDDVDVDCVVSDYEMPDMDGLELLERVRDRDSEMPFLLYTGRGSEEVASEAISLDVTEYVRKGDPDTLDDVVETARDAVREHDVHLFRSQTKQEPFELLERMGEAVYAVDRDWRFTYLNGSAAELFDASADEVVGEEIWKVAPDLRETELYDAYHEAMERQEPRTVEAAVENQGVWRREHLYPADDGLAVLSVDVTDRVERERELRESERRYDAFFNDPNILAAVLDSDGRLVDINRRAMEYVDAEVDEVTGEVFWETPWWSGGVRRKMEDWVKRAADGEYVEYEMEHEGDRSRSYVSEGVIRPVKDDDGVRSLVVSARDVTRERRYRESLEGLNENARRIISTEDELEIAEVVVDDALELAGVSSAVFYSFDEESTRLSPAAWCPGFDGDGLPEYRPGEGRMWEVFSGADVTVLGDCDLGELFGGEAVDSVVASTGGHGVLVVATEDDDGFDGLTVDLVETLAMTAEAAFERAENTEMLRRARRESERRAKSLDRVNRLNEEIRRVVRSTVAARDAGETREAACRAAVEIDGVEFAWVLERDVSGEGMSVAAKAGHAGSFLEGDAAEFDVGPEGEALESGEVVVEDVSGSDAPYSTWRNRVLIRGFREVLAAPLEHDGLVYGVLGVYSVERGVLDDVTAEVFEDLGELVGYGLHSIEHRYALLGGGDVELVFEFTVEDDVLRMLSTSLDADLSVENLVDRSEGGYLLQISVDADVEAVENEVEDVTGLEAVDVASRADVCMVEAVVGREELAPRLGRLGAGLASVRVSGARCRAVLSVPVAADRREIVERMKEEFSDVELVAHRRVEREPVVDVSDVGLTERQLEVLRAAYHSGYFDRDRKVTGGEIAERLGVSQPSFSKVLRDAERRLLDGLLGDSGMQASLVDGDGT